MQPTSCNCIIAAFTIALKINKITRSPDQYYGEFIFAFRKLFRFFNYSDELMNRKLPTIQ